MVDEKISPYQRKHVPEAEAQENDRKHDEIVKIQKTQNELIKKQTRFNYILAIGVLITGIYYCLKLYDMGLRTKSLIPEENFYLMYLGGFVLVLGLILIASIALIDKK